GHLPAPIAESLRQEIAKVVKASSADRQFPNTDECHVLLAYCGDKEGLDETRRLAMRTREATNRDAGVGDEHVRIRAVEAILYADLPAEVRRMVEQILAEAERSSSADFRGKVLDLLGDRGDADLARVVLESYSKLEPELKPRAIEELTERPAWSKLLLNAI